MIKRLIRILNHKMFRKTVIKITYAQDFCPIEYNYLVESFNLWKRSYETDYSKFIWDIKYGYQLTVNYVFKDIEHIKRLIQEDKHRIRMLNWAYNHGYHKNKNMVNGKDVHDKMEEIKKFYNKIKDFNPDLVIKQIKMKEKLKRLKEDF